MDKDRSTRLKRRALYIGGIGIAVSIVAGLLYIGMRDDSTTSWNQIMFYGCVFIIAGVLLSWLVSLFVYGYGVLMDERAQARESRRGRKEEPAKVSRVYMPTEM